MHLAHCLSKASLFLFLAFFGFFISSAQERGLSDSTSLDITFESFELPGEDSGNSVQVITQDKLGYLWFGSQSGLHRYDGNNFTTYNSDPINQNTINSDYIEDIYIDSDGIIWMTHWGNGGITSYDEEREIFTRYNYDPEDPTSIHNGETGAIIQGPEGDIWIGGRNGLSRFNRDTGTFRRYSHDPDDPASLSDVDVGELYVDKEGTLWVATGMPWEVDGEGGLNRYNPETDSFDRFLHDPEDPTTLTNNKVRTLFEDSNGNLWVGTAGDGLHRFDRESETFIHYPYDPEEPNKLAMPFLEGSDLSTSNIWSHISSISEDSEGRLWIAAVYSGLNVYDPTSGDLWHFEGSEGTGMLHSSFVWETFESDDGTIWVSTGGEGREVYKIKEEPFTIPFFEFNELRDSLSTVRGILKDATGSIWIAHSPFSPNEPLLRSSLWKIDPTLSDIRKIRIEPDAPSASLSNFMGSISLDATGNIWAGTTEGYFIGDTRQEDFKKFIPDIDFPEGTWWIPPILKSSRGAIWIPYLGRGVIRYEPESDTYEVFEHDPDILGSLSGATVWGIYEDRAGNIWVGGGSFTPSTDTPIFMDRYNPDSKSFEPYISTIMPYGIVSDIVEDELGNLWFIDWNSGLYKLNPGTREIKRLTSSNSLLPGSGISSLLKHPDGMLWLATERELIEFDPINETLSIYDERHGVVPAGGFSESGFLTEDGSLLFARYEGFHAFRPDTLLTGLNSRLPDLRITGFQLLDDNLYSGSSSSYEVLDAPIWETEHIQLERSQNTFAFSIACFDFYEPDRNTLQFMLEGYDRGWRGDLRNGETPFFVNVPPGKYTFKIRGSNGLGVWDTEGVQMTIEILPPWWQRWWALVLFALIVVVTGFGFHKWQRQRVLIKERKRAQAKELEQAREIEKAYHQLKETQQQLIHSEKMASLGELTAGIAHEIQNPLNFVNNFSEVSSELIEEMTQEMDKGELEEVRAIAKDLRQNLDKITHHGQRADSIVKGMLQHSRNHDGKKEPTDLNKLADEYLRLAYHGLRAKDKTFNAATETDFDPDLPKIQVVPQDMGRVLLNLLTNAFHAVNEKKTDNVPDYKPKVTITSRMTEKGVAISVSDNGNGIPDSIRDKIFQPFFTTKATGEGTGLGLSMSYDIVKKAHGGELNLNSEEGQGTTFTVFLPLSDPPNPNLN